VPGDTNARTDAFIHDLHTSGGDWDGDGFIYYEDCDDSDAAVYPGAPDIKFDGIDQDCNGYDLTIDIIVADYNGRKDVLEVEATSDLGVAADLWLAYPGFSAPMGWNSKKVKWALTVDPVGGDPGSIVVVGIEGSETAFTGGEPPCVPETSNEIGFCSDGVDNDCDGFTDGNDLDCPVVDCGQYTDRQACNAESVCKWSNKNKVCVNR